jgi:spore germination cell wall hydrolase CwlJ-like protein
VIKLLAIAALAVVTDAVASDHEVVAVVLCAEASVAGKTGMEAVHEVIVNRAAKSGRTARQVVTSRKAFSCLNGRTIGGLLSEFRGTPVFRVAMQIVTGEATNHTKGANHYHAANCSPYWAEGARPTACVGGHKFYKL